MTDKEKLADRDYMASVHLGHAEWWRDRIKNGELRGSQIDNALDMIRIHEAHAWNKEEE